MNRTRVADEPVVILQSEMSYQHTLATSVFVCHVTKYFLLLAMQMNCAERTDAFTLQVDTGTLNVYPSLITTPGVI